MKAKMAFPWSREKDSIDVFGKRKLTEGQRMTLLHFESSGIERGFCFSRCIENQEIERSTWTWVRRNETFMNEGDGLVVGTGFREGGNIQLLPEYINSIKIVYSQML